MGVGYMLIGGRLARIDVHAPTVETRSGVRVGMAEGDVLRAYGAGVTRSPHFYGDADDHYLSLHSRDGVQGMRFETEDGKVTRFYAGTAESMEYVEGCL